MSKALTNDELLRCVEAFNEFSREQAKRPVELQKLTAPLGDKLYAAALLASEQLPARFVTVATKK